MRRVIQYVFAIAIVISTPTLSQAATKSLDPDGQALTTALLPWADSLLSVFLTFVGI